jgi:hypothetical protein
MSLVLAALDPAAARDAVYAAHAYQRELPGHAGSGSASAEPQTIDLLNVNLGSLAVLLQVLFWAAVIAGAAILALWLVRALRERARPPEERSAKPQGEKLGDVPLQDAEAFAGAGRFAEAIHVLLLRTLELLAVRQGARLVPSWTSREVVNRVRCPEAARGALADLVEAVESCWFAGNDPSADDYGRCVDRFRDFSAAYDRGAP